MISIIIKNKTCFLSSKDSQSGEKDGPIRKVNVKFQTTISTVLSISSMGRLFTTIVLHLCLFIIPSANQPADFSKQALMLGITLGRGYTE